jgi:hypothetical protein
MPREFPGLTDPEEWRDGAAEVRNLAPWSARLTSFDSVREALTQHRGEILVLSGGRRTPIDALLEHLDSCQLASCSHEWAQLACAVGFEEKVDPAAVDAPWSAPDAAPCWRGLRGPLFHLWVIRGPACQPQLFGLIVPDRRATSNVSEIVQLLGGESSPPQPGDSAHRLAPFGTVEHVEVEIRLSNYIVDGPYLSAELTKKLNLPKPAGDGWWQSWWRVREAPEAWQHGWARWK